MKYLPVIYVSAVLIVGSCNQKTIEQTPVKEFPTIMVTDVQKKISAKDNILLLQSKLDNAIRVNNNRLNYNEDGMEGITVPFVSDNKYLNCVIPSLFVR